jgi:hypothetical protein
MEFSHAPQRRSGLASLFERSADEGEQGNLASLLDCGSHCSLMTCTCTGLAARADLAIFGDIFPKHVCFLVINCQRLICTELTKLGLCKEATFTALSFTSTSPLWSSIFSHLLLQFLVQKPDGLARRIFADPNAGRRIRV